MSRRSLTPRDLWTCPRVGKPAVAPNGEFVIVPVTTHDLDANRGVTRLWLVPCPARASARSAERPRPLTSIEASASSPVISPDGKQLAFVRKPLAMPVTTGAPAPQSQLYVMSIDGGEPERLTQTPLGVAEPKWFPDGRSIAFISHVYADAPTLAATATRHAERTRNPVQARVTENRFYRYWDEWRTDGKVQHVFAIELETRAVLDLTPASHRWSGEIGEIDTYALAPDGRELSFEASSSRPPHDPLTFSVFSVRLPSRLRAGAKVGPAVARVMGGIASAAHPAYSPDGRWLVYGVTYEHDFYADRTRLVAYDRSAKRHTVLTESWDRSPSSWTFGAEGALYAVAETNARTAIFRVDVAKAARSPRRYQPKELTRGGTHSPCVVRGKRIFTSISTLSSPPEVYCHALDGSAKQRITTFTKAAMAPIALGRVSEYLFDGAEGDPVQMYVVLPPERGPRSRPGKRRAAKLPLVHLIHGGPHAVFGDQWHWRWNAHCFAARGAAAALVNFHGSTSWGQAFTASILGRWGDQPYVDIMKATDLLVDEGLVDARRMAATGGSYGGYLAAWIASQTKRFACIVNHAGVSDVQTQYASDVTQGRRRAFGGEPWDNVEGLDRWNPVRHARGFRSPMLVLHGEQDYRVPYAQGLEVYNIYKAMRRPARLVCYPDENHWILKPQNSLHWHDEVFAWLDRWLGTRTRPSKRTKTTRRTR